MHRVSRGRGIRIQRSSAKECRKPHCIKSIELRDQTTRPTVPSLDRSFLSIAAQHKFQSSVPNAIAPLPRMAPPISYQTPKPNLIGLIFAMHVIAWQLSWLLSSHLVQYVQLGGTVQTSLSTLIHWVSFTI